MAIRLKFPAHVLYPFRRALRLRVCARRNNNIMSYKSHTYPFLHRHPAACLRHHSLYQYLHRLCHSFGVHTLGEVHTLPRRSLHGYSNNISITRSPSQQYSRNSARTLSPHNSCVARFSTLNQPNSPTHVLLRQHISGHWKHHTQLTRIFVARTFCQQTKERPGTSRIKKYSMSVLI